MTYDGADNTLRDGRPRTTTSTSASSRCAARHQARPADELGAQARAVDQAHRPPRRDRQPDRPREARRSTPSPSSRTARATRTAASDLSGPGESLFRFVQFEFPGRSGRPPAATSCADAGDEDALRVLVIGTLGALERRLLPAPQAREEGRAAARARARPDHRARRSCAAGPRRASTRRASTWAAGELVIDEELAILNRVLHLHRVAAADTAVREVARDDALVVRVGYGAGRAGRRRPLDRGGRARPRGTQGASAASSACARRSASRRCSAAATPRWPARSSRCARAADFDAGRPREAALQLRVALEAAIAELEAWRERGDLGERLAELREERRAVGDAANAALRGGLDDATVDDGRARPAPRRGRAAAPAR